MSETESHCENLEKGVIDETTEQQPEIEKDASAGSKIIHIDNFRRNLIISLWGGGCVGAATGYVVSVLKGAGIQLYMTSMTMTFGFGSMVFYGSYHYLRQGLGDTIWPWTISGAFTGVVGGLIANPRYLPVTTLCFAGLGVLGFFANRAGRRYITMKRYRLKEKAGTLTDEERQERDKMKIWRKDRLHDFIKFKTNYSIVCYYYLQPHIKIVNGSSHDDSFVEEIEHFNQILVFLRTHCRSFIHHHQIMLVVLMDSIHHPLDTTQKINDVFLNICIDD